MRRYIIYILSLLFPLGLLAQGDGTQLMAKAVDKLTADYPLQMTFVVSTYNADGAMLFVDEGSLRLGKKQDNSLSEQYVLLMDNMKLWCDGNTLWSYMVPTNEVYILSPDDESARIFSPVHLMQLYKQGYSCYVKKSGDSSVVTLEPQGEESELSMVDVTLNASTLRPEKIVVYMGDDGYTELKIASYWPRCNFDSRIFSYPQQDYPDAELVDMR